MNDSTPKPADPAPMTVQGSLGRSMSWLWHDRPTWFRALIGWWALPFMIVIWWMIIFGESMNRSRREFEDRRILRDMRIAAEQEEESPQS